MSKIILITGASSGFGRLAAEALAGAGHIVYASMRNTINRNAAAVEQIAAHAKQYGVQLRSLELDVQSQDSADAAIGRAGDRQKWLDQFADGVQLYDDGQPRDFTMFSQEIGKERFTSVDRVSDDGLEIVGDFHSDTWGDFRSYFRFTVDDSGKISKLEIGQT